MENLSPEAKKYLCIILDPLSYGKVRMIAGPEKASALYDELEALVAKLEQDVLSSGQVFKKRGNLRDIADIG